MALQPPPSLGRANSSFTDMEYASNVSTFQPFQRNRRMTSLPQDELGFLLREFRHELTNSASPFLQLTANSYRREALMALRRALLRGLLEDVGSFGMPPLQESLPARPGAGFQSTLADIGVGDMGQRAHAPNDYLHHVSHAAQSWSFLRFRELMRKTKPDRRIPQPVCGLIESAHWAVIASEMPRSDGVSPDDEDVADEQVWDRYCVKILGKAGPMPSSSDPDGVIALMGIREEALSYFLEHIQLCLHHLNTKELVQAILYCNSLSTAPVLLAHLWSHAVAHIAAEELRDQVLPKVILASTCRREPWSVAAMRVILEKVKHIITSDLINSVLEYAAHMHDADCGIFVIENYRDLITVEGIIAAVIAASGKGNDHILALLEVFIIEKIDSDTDANASGPGSGQAWVVDSTLDITTQFGARVGEFTALVSPYIYLWLGVSAYAGHAKHTTITNLIDFYNDTFESILLTSIDETKHRKYVRTLFHMACRKNHWNIVWSLIENKWMPSDILDAVREAISLGHQKILHILLESMLVADPKIKTPTGSVPVIFRKPSILRALPLIAKRFPGEVAWFLEQLSLVPIPGCVPRTTDHDPVVQARLVRGVRLGKIALTDVTKPPDPAWPPNYLWDNLQLEGQLRRAGMRRGESDYEKECVICMAPEALVTEQALRDGVAPSFAIETNALIRLLSTGDEAIILNPITQALMEYHWHVGRFWWRYAAQISSVVLFIAATSYLFELVVVQQITGTPIDYGTLVGVCTSTLVLAAIFLVQEFRQFLDQPMDYVTSIANMMDLGIHICVIYIVFQGAIARQTIKPLIMSIVLLLLSVRLLMHLRILPSVGPLVRITVLASVHVLPILIPMSIMAFAFAGGIYLVETGEVPGTRWTNIWIALQYVVTMITYDYNVLDDASRFDIFFLRIAYHIVYIIFFLNVIIALMTVNIADISANTTAAWLVEVAQLMVELELYWPYPMKIPHAASGAGQHGHMEEYLMSKIGSITSAGSSVHSIKIDDCNDGDSGTYASASSQFMAQLSRHGVVLYTGQRDLVVEKVWWSGFPRLTEAARKQSTFGADSSRPSPTAGGFPNVSSPAGTIPGDDKPSIGFIGTIKERLNAANTLKPNGVSGLAKMLSGATNNSRLQQAADEHRSDPSSQVRSARVSVSLRQRESIISRNNRRESYMSNRGAQPVTFRRDSGENFRERLQQQVIRGGTTSGGHAESGSGHNHGYDSNGDTRKDDDHHTGSGEILEPQNEMLLNLNHSAIMRRPTLTVTSILHKRAMVQARDSEGSMSDTGDRPHLTRKDSEQSHGRLSVLGDQIGVSGPNNMLRRKTLHDFHRAAGASSANGSGGGAGVQIDTSSIGSQPLHPGMIGSTRNMLSDDRIAGERSASQLQLRGATATPEDNDRLRSLVSGIDSFMRIESRRTRDALTRMDERMRASQTSQTESLDEALREIRALKADLRKLTSSLKNILISESDLRNSAGSAAHMSPRGPASMAGTGAGTSTQSGLFGMVFGHRNITRTHPMDGDAA
ncbi:hypothetical protein HK105_207705 [Polyrhizophydium stewartii]|uniref:Ion transport domain-containing protein n=1 Tax=Polyrhizophydium stewartii TaxID=2732419 RepID=A0ABR4MZU9_9FUNG|nr:hypothetical protein HK105_002475 [Polyrhizophydium stewartii]